MTRVLTIFFVFGVALGIQSVAQLMPQAAAPPHDQSSSSTNRTRKVRPESLKNLPRNIVEDQKNIWTSPFRMKRRDWVWFVPAAGVLGAVIHSDTDGYRGLSVSAVKARSSRRFSDAGVSVLGTGVASMYLLGRIRGNDHLRETGILGAEAALNSLVVGQGLGYALGRERPTAGRGQFFQRGNSFPSTHSMTAWAMATVVAREYPGRVTRFGAYALASAVSFSRITGQKHFPADAIVGSVMGWGIARQMYHSRARDNFPEYSIGTFVRAEPDEDPTRKMGSVSASMDSWIYPAISRLAGLGRVDSAFMGMRPWTRLECARLLIEAKKNNDIREADEAGGGDFQAASKLISALSTEFAEEVSVSEGGAWDQGVRLDSIYSRGTAIAGPNLTDGMHLGQTNRDDYGRPSQRGFNWIQGFSASGDFGRLAFHIDGEYQHAPASEVLPAGVLAFIAQRDLLPALPTGATGQIDRLRILDAYASLTMNDWQLSFGRQSLRWGPADAGALNYSQNAEPVMMVRLSRAKPAVLPSFLHLLGPMRADFFFGQLAGHRFANVVGVGTFGPGFSPQPLIHGQKLSFRPTPNLEFGVSATTLWGGPGIPLNLKTFLRSFSLNNTIGGQLDDPGDRRAGFDFSYRLPWLRQWLTVYNDSMTEDEFSPIAYPRRSAMNPGLYLSHVPKVPNLDLRLEGFYTDLPGLQTVGTYYFNSHFLGGFTNQGSLLGHPVGRQGSGFLVKSAYWFSGINRVNLSFRRTLTSPEFVPGGNQVNDIASQVTWRLRPRVHFTLHLQYENWKAPILAATRNSNFTTSFEVRILTPQVRWKVRKTHAP